MDQPTAAPESPRLFFMHIPKTAGSSVRRMLESAPATRGRCCWLQGGDPASEAAELSCLESALVTGGHVRWDDAAALPGGWRIGAVLRDPLDRLLSLYSFQRMRIAAGAPSDASPVLRRELATRSFESLVHDPDARFFRFTLPTQTLYFGGAERGFIPARGAMLDESALAPVFHQAMARLEETAWLGVTDTLDRDMETLADGFGWPPFGPAQRSNQTDPGHRLREGDLDAGTLQALRERLAPDERLVARAREIAAARHGLVSRKGGGVGAGEGPDVSAPAPRFMPVDRSAFHIPHSTFHAPGRGPRTRMPSFRGTRNLGGRGKGERDPSFLGMMKVVAADEIPRSSG